MSKINKILSLWKVGLVLCQKNLQIHVVDWSVNLTYWDTNFVPTFFSQKYAIAEGITMFIPV